MPLLSQLSLALCYAGYNLTHVMVCCAPDSVCTLHINCDYTCHGMCLCAAEDVRHAGKDAVDSAKHAIKKGEIKAGTAAEESKQQGKGFMAKLFGRGREKKVGV